MRIITICSDGIFPVISQQALFTNYTDTAQFGNDFEIFMRSLNKQMILPNTGKVLNPVLPKTVPKNRQERINELLDELSSLSYGKKEIPPE